MQSEGSIQWLQLANRPPAPSEPFRNLAAAVILQAVEDARRPEKVVHLTGRTPRESAEKWLREGTGLAFWAWVLGVEESVVRRYAARHCRSANESSIGTVDRISAEASTPGRTSEG